jgi:hypothetical protein
MEACGGGGRVEELIACSLQTKRNGEEKRLLRRVLDETGKGYVFPSTFANFLKSFGPFAKVDIFLLSFPHGVGFKDSEFLKH